MVTATKLICDVDVVRGINIIQHGSRGQWTAFNKLFDTLTSTKETLQHCQCWAQSGWLLGMKETLACLTDTAGLRKCGIETDFKAFEVCGLTPEHASVRFQDASSGPLGTSPTCRSGSAQGRSQSVHITTPLKLAALTSDDPDVVAAALQEFRMDVEAFWASKEFEAPREPPNGPNIHPEGPQ